MKCYRTTKEFMRAVCREMGQHRPKQTCYIVQDCHMPREFSRRRPIPTTG